MCMSDLSSPQPLEIEYDRWMRKWQSETSKPERFNLPHKIEVVQFVFVQIPLR